MPFCRWLAIPVAAAVVNAAQRRAAVRAQEEAEEEARRANPFAGMSSFMLVVSPIASLAR